MSNAYSDYVVRLTEVIVLLRAALAAKDSTEASAMAKGAVVLAAAALERFLNDVIAEACKSIKATTWSDLAAGQKRYLTAQMAKRASAAAMALDDKASQDKKRVAFQRIVEACYSAYANPSTWTYHPEYGLFSEASTEPSRLNGILRDFDPEERDFYQTLDLHPAGKQPFVTALKQLVDARHGVAHALAESRPPGPTDVRNWVVTTFWLARRVDRFLRGHGAA